MISKKELEHIAELARLGLSIQEKKRFQKELSLVLSYVEQLKEVDIRGIKSSNHSGLIKNVFRKDYAQIFLSAKFSEKTWEGKKKVGRVNKKLLALAPVIKDRYLKVKSIL